MSLPAIHSPTQVARPSLTSKQEQILKLLGDGYGPEVVASTVGCAVSLVSGLLSDPEFRDRVSEARMAKVTKYNDVDNLYDETELSVAKKLKDAVEFEMNSMKLVKIATSLNSMRRRGSSSPEAIVNNQTVLNLALPSVIVNQFQVKAQNVQINAPGSVDTSQPDQLQLPNKSNEPLVTLQSGSLAALAKQYREKGIQNATKIPISAGQTVKLSG